MGKLVKGGFKMFDKAFGTHLGGRGSKKAAPAASDPVMPLPDDEAVRAARRRSIAQQSGRSGRASTILTDSGDKLGP